MIEPAKVRIAARDEEDAILGLCRELHAENGMVSMDDDLVRAMLRRSFDRQGGIIGAIGAPGAIEAMIFLLLTSFWSSRDTHLEELFSFVRPDHRKSDHAETLVRFAVQCAKECEIPLVIGVVTSKRLAGKVRLYRRVLGNPSGAYFVVNAKWDSEPADRDFWEQVYRERSPRKGAERTH